MTGSAIRRWSDLVPRFAATYWPSRTARRQAFVGLSLVVLLTATWAGNAGAAPSAEQRREVAQLRTEIRKAGNLFKQGKFRESADVVRDIQQRVEKLSMGADRELLVLLEPAYKSLQTAHALLELEGEKLPPLKLPGEGPTPAGDGVSFTKQVAPILVSKCGRCHVNSSRGMFSMASFESLMKGTPDGVVLFAGDADGSRLIEVIETGDMPRGGLKVSEEELATLKQWVVAGARYDGQDPAANLSSLAPMAAPAEAMEVEVVRATGNEKILFARDIAPVLAEQCANCHGAGQRASGQLDLNRFQAMLRGGDSGPPIIPGKPAESLLIRKLRGTASGERMPRGKPPLPEETIAMVETWIQEGAKFDGPDPNQPVAEVAALDRARRATHEELAAERAALAEKNWGLGLPGVSSSQVETEHFRIRGDAGAATLEDYGKQAEALVPQISAILKVPEGRPFIKGRLTLFFFSRRYDYSEFGKMVEERQLPIHLQGHWRYSVIDGYVAILRPQSDDPELLDSLLTQQIAASYVASIGDVPRWFAEGSGRVVASRLQRQDARVAAWDAQLPRVLASMSKPDDFLTGKLGPEQTEIAAYSFVRFLMSGPQRHEQLLESLREGTPFSQAFSAAYGGSPEQIAALWTRQAARGSRR